MSNGPVNASAPNSYRLLWAGFVAILAAGIGFAIRGGILANWGAEFGFTGTQLGAINGAGFTGFCFGIIVGGFLCDRIGYGKLVVAAFVFHVLSAVVTFSASSGMPKDTVYLLLYIGTFIFAVANGTLEAVANPLVATLFPNKRTHYLNILHASWPAGLIIGGLAGAILGERLHWSWKMQLGLFLIATVIYGFMFLGQKMPRSEASQKGLKLGEMMQDVGLLGGLVVCILLGLFVKGALGPTLAILLKSDFFTSPTWGYISWALAAVLWIAVAAMTRGAVGHWLLFILFVVHALVGAVELGTDGWIQNITGNILSVEAGKWLFVYTSLIMFSLRFCADFIEKRIGLSPVGILLACSVLAAIGLNLISISQSTVMVMLALLVYAVGKTFLWPTMLAVASDRFPRTGAIAISIMGGVGMMSAGLIGSPGLGYAKDRFAGEELRKVDPAIYSEYKADQPSKFLIFSEVTGLDGKKLGEVKQQVEQAKKTSTGGVDPISTLPPKDQAVARSDLKGDRRTLVADSFIPMAMAVIYLLILLYFRTIGGYKPIHIVETQPSRVT